MFFIQKMFVVTMFLFSWKALNAISLKCVSMTNQECRIRAKIINITIIKITVMDLYFILKVFK